MKRMPALVRCQWRTMQVSSSICTGENTLKSGAGRAGIHVAENASLTIRGDGKLTVTGGNCAAGIGGGLWNNAGNITIEGGTIEATGGSGGAGVGGGHANEEKTR